VKYLDALREAMSLCAAEPNSIIMGQSVRAGGTALRRTLDHLPDEKLLELPVFENTQMGMATGMAIGGMLPICCFPRWNFLLSATDQLVNHLDKLPLMSNGGYRPRVIIRVAVPSDQPLDPGSQHLGNFSGPYRAMLKTVEIAELHSPAQVRTEYRRALMRPDCRSTILVEFSELYDG
jgi:pyruvate/2-oxoglutarate/acetoin dehydrogenase E1 component